MINQKPNIQNVVMCADVFIRKDGKYLLLKRSKYKKYAPNIISPFGGKIDQNENPYDGAIREIKEEAGIDIKNLKLESVILELTKDPEVPVNRLVFQFSADYDKGEVIASDEGEAVLLSKEELLASDLFPSVRSIINNILNPKDGTVFTTNSYDSFANGMVELSKNICIV